MGDRDIKPSIPLGTPPLETAQVIAPEGALPGVESEIEINLEALRFFEDFIMLF